MHNLGSIRGTTVLLLLVTAGHRRHRCHTKAPECTINRRMEAANHPLDREERVGLLPLNDQICMGDRLHSKGGQMWIFRTCQLVERCRDQ